MWLAKILLLLVSVNLIHSTTKGSHSLKITKFFVFGRAITGTTAILPLILLLWLVRCGCWFVARCPVDVSELAYGQLNMLGHTRLAVVQIMRQLLVVDCWERLEDLFVIHHYCYDFSELVWELTHLKFAPLIQLKHVHLYLFALV